MAYQAKPKRSEIVITTYEMTVVEAAIEINALLQEMSSQHGKSIDGVILGIKFPIDLHKNSPAEIVQSYYVVKEKQKTNNNET